MSVQVKNLFYTYNPKSSNESHAVNGVSLTIQNNDFVAILGRTGSGKSTLIQTFNALLLPMSGEVEIDEFKVLPKKNKNIKELRKHLGIVFQFPEYQLFEETIEKDVAFGLKNFGAKDDEAIEKAHEALEKVGLDSSYFKRSPFELSGGEKRRVALAGILAIDPDILVLDEPTAGLDYQGRKDVMELVKKLHQDGKTIIVVTHDMDIVLKYTNKVFVLKKGKLVFEGKPDELFECADESMGIEIPMVYSFAQKLIKKGVDIDIKEIKNVDDLVNQINAWRKK